MAFHAIKAGEGDTYIAAGVEAVSRAGRGSAQFEFNHMVDGSEGSAYDGCVHPNGHDRRESWPSAATSAARPRTSGP